MLNKNDKLWELVNDIWSNGYDCSDKISKYDKLYQGKLEKSNEAIDFFPSEKKTPFNIIKPIINTKYENMLDAQFSISVFPRINNLNDIEEVRNQELVAEIFNIEIKNIFKDNRMETKKNILARNGFKYGYSACQVLWDTYKYQSGRVKITPIDSKNLRWDKNSTCAEDNTFFAYKIKESPAKIKDKYCRNADGSYDEEKCKLVDKLTKSDSENKKSSSNKVVSYKEDNMNVSGQAFVDKTSGIQTNKYVSMIVMFLIDDTLYSPNEEDTQDIETAKKESLKKYPNGRMIVFCENEDEKVIFEDMALPKTFEDLGNIEIFNPIQGEGIKGETEIADLEGIQKRINGSFAKFRLCLANDITTIAVNKDSGLKQSDFVNFPVVFTEREDQAQILSNNGIDKARGIIEIIQSEKEMAYEMARVNETMMYGARQTGTTSGEQVEALQESPMVGIRTYQRSFKDFMINVTNKVLSMIIHNYNLNRIINLVDSSKKYSYAEIFVKVDEDHEQRIINVYDKQGKQVKQIRFNPEWEFDVDVVAGTEVPRSRKENAMLMDKLIAQGVINQIQDPDLLEIYMKSQDIPNWRNLIDILREKQEQAQQYSNSEEAKNWKNVIKNPDIAKSFSDFFKAIDGYSKAKQQMLIEVGLAANPGKLDDTPVTEITSQSQVAEVAAIAPSIISDDNNKIQNGYDMSITETLKKQNGGINASK